MATFMIEQWSSVIGTDLYVLPTIKYLLSSPLQKMPAKSGAKKEDAERNNLCLILFALVFAIENLS